MFLEAIVIAVIVGLLAGGKLNNLAKIRLNMIWLVFAAFFIQIMMDYLVARGYKSVLDFRMVLYGLSYCMLLVFLYYNRKVSGIILLTCGFILNFVVIMANGGTMPVSEAGLPPETVSVLMNQGAALHSLASSETRFLWLGDMWICPWINAKISVGDVFISLGVFWLVFKTITNQMGASKLTSVRNLKL